MTKANGKSNGKPGRPKRQSIDPALVDRICRLIRIPTFPEVAARSSGIHPATFYRWMQRGGDHVCDPEDKTRIDPECKREDHFYRDFSESIERARSDAEIALTTLVRQAAIGVLYRNHRPDCATAEPGLTNSCQCPIVTLAPNWFASARMLESFSKARWLRTERVEHTGAGGGPVEVADSPADRITKQTKKVAARLFAQMADGKRESGGSKNGH